MTNSLLITKYLREILSKDKELMKMIPIDKIFAIDAKLSTKFPFAAIERTNITSIRCKDGQYEDTVSVTIYIADNTYIGSVNIANEIRHWLEGHRYKDDTITISDVRLSGASEVYVNDAYIHKLDFEIKVN